MADWVGKTLDRPWVGGPWSGGGFWSGRVWPTPTDVSPPVVSLVSPTAGAADLAPSTPLVFDVTENAAIRRIFVVARFPLLGIAELVHDGGAQGFEALYAKNSTKVPISNGFRFSILRSNGWPFGAGVELKVYAIDTSGNENT